MKITILGAGAMGCLIGGRMVAAGHPVTFVARGAQLAALQQSGLTLESPNERWQGPVSATGDTASLGAQDTVILTCKANQLEGMMPLLAPLLGPDTMVVPAVNGLPWWYFQNHGGEFDGRRLESLDPTGAIAAAIAPHHIVGCVNYLAGTLIRPGYVHYVPELERRLALGEIDGTTSARVERLAAMLGDAGFAPVVTPNIREPMWHKLWGNIAFNPISALTHGTIDQLAEDYNDIDLLTSVMNEARNIADKLGITLAQTTKSRVAAAAKMRGHKTSMLVDLEQGRACEIEAIVGAVREIGKWMEESTPYLNALYSLVKLKAQFYRASVSGDTHT
ncbi:MAG: ketopantoate reductase family protein [Rickettsiales bacterium]